MDALSKFSLAGVRLAGGEETPMFEATLVLLQRNGLPRSLARVVNHGRGGPCMFHPEPPVTHTWINEKLAPLVAKEMAKKYPEFAEVYVKYPGEALSSFALDLLTMWGERQRIQEQLARQFDEQATQEASYKERQRPRTTPTQRFRIGQKVRFGRKRGEKTLGRVVKVNKKSLKVEILEDRGSKSRSGEFWRVSPGLCEVVS